MQDANPVCLSALLVVSILAQPILRRDRVEFQQNGNQIVWRIPNDVVARGQSFDCPSRIGPQFIVGRCERCLRPRGGVDEDLFSNAIPTARELNRL